jgi:hypothetical protein
VVHREQALEQVRVLDLLLQLVEPLDGAVSQGLHASGEVGEDRDAGVDVGLRGLALHADQRELDGHLGLPELVGEQLVGVAGDRLSRGPLRRGLLAGLDLLDELGQFAGSLGDGAAQRLDPLVGVAQRLLQPGLGVVAGFVDPPVDVVGQRVRAQVSDDHDGDAGDDAHREDGVAQFRRRDEDQRDRRGGPDQRRRGQGRHDQPLQLRPKIVVGWGFGGSVGLDRG